MARILLVEDDPPLQRGLAAMLRTQGYAVDIAATGEQALEVALAEPYAALILDVGLPGISGFEVLSRLRQRGCRTSILILTARDTIQDRVTGLDLGADDYLLKPFDPAELEARLRALLRRTQGNPSPVITVGSLVIDRSHGSAQVNGRALDLRRREWAVLERLIVRPGKLVSKERLTNEVFGFDDPVAPNVIEVYVARLRRKLEPDGPHIRTLRGLGYILEES